ncbi:hypothetical protein ABER23_06880 [Paenibacillus lautus]
MTIMDVDMHILTNWGTDVDGMVPTVQQGFGGTFDQLAKYLESQK